MQCSAVQWLTNFREEEPRKTIGAARDPSRMIDWADVILVVYSITRFGMVKVGEVSSFPFCCTGLVGSWLVRF